MVRRQEPRQRAKRWRFAWRASHWGVERSAGAWGGVTSTGHLRAWLGNVAPYLTVRRLFMRRTRSLEKEVKPRTRLELLRGLSAAHQPRTSVPLEAHLIADNPQPRPFP